MMVDQVERAANDRAGARDADGHGAKVMRNECLAARRASHRQPAIRRREADRARDLDGAPAAAGDRLAVAGQRPCATLRDVAQEDRAIVPAIGLPAQREIEGPGRTVEHCPADVDIGGDARQRRLAEMRAVPRLVVEAPEPVRHVEPSVAEQRVPVCGSTTVRLPSSSAATSLRG